MKLSKEEATAFFADWYRGEHHFPSKIQPYGDGWSMSHIGSVATFDFDDLTRLVLLAHEKCIRAQIEQGGPNRVKIAIWKREREGSLFERHPTIEQAIEAFREGPP
ncbi:hypothetical protein M0R72_17825 [Candidatus Pacearchaeota archaeon]|jgi:hypothetical protein|nr:hypothetical protein [Candidatus Pacearchaeota archaeon]